MFCIYCTGIFFCYLKQRFKKYKLFNKHNKSVGLCDIGITSDGIGFVCKLYSCLIILSMQHSSKHRFKFTEVAKCESRVFSIAIKHDHSKVATAATGHHWRRL